jgi:hypothetical protein
MFGFGTGPVARPGAWTLDLMTASKPDLRERSQAAREA